jgi:hypothetical protein
MNLKQRIDGFAKVGLFIKRHFTGEHHPTETALHQGLDALIKSSHIWNNWFIPKFVKDAIFNIGVLLEERELSDFARGINNRAPKTIAVICAGNIPMVGFHDILCVLLSGHRIQIKLSDDDKILMPFFLKLLTHYEPLFEERISFAAGKLQNFDAIIATGSDNTASHLHYYFGKYPNIIRKSRTSLAILTGKERTEDLKNLGTDIFQYFGLGCRNVSKLLVPAGYSFNTFFESIVDFGFVVDNKKYGNNYDYHRTIYLLESQPFLDNNFLIVKESLALHSPVAVLHYQHYNDLEEMEAYLAINKNQIQCVVGKDRIPFGYSQQPVISEFADNVNTLDFLVNL